MSLNQNNAQNSQIATLHQINQMFGSLENMYLSVEQLGYYLPDLKCSCITAYFLIRVVNGEIFSVKRSKIAPGGAKTIKNKTKIELYEILYSLAQQQEKKDLGFDLNRLPNKQYILDLIHVLKPNHSLFKLEDDSELSNHQIKFPIDAFKQIQTRYLPTTGQNLFRRTKEQIEDDKKKEMAQRVSKKETRLRMLLEESQKVEERLKLLKNVQQDNQMIEN
ncbi:hypothetical protein ABPG74_005773 [Tetrahymena malaccensis]